MIRDFLPEDFDRVFEIIEESFPRDERGTYDEHKKLLSDPAYRIYILQDDESGVIKGFMSVWDLGEEAHIDHFAMAPEFRNGGNGGKMLCDMVKHLGKMVTLEAEPPESEPDESAEMLWNAMPRLSASKTFFARPRTSIGTASETLSSVTGCSFSCGAMCAYSTIGPEIIFGKKLTYRQKSSGFFCAGARR